MSATYTFEEISMMFEILQKSGRIDHIKQKFTDLKFHLGDRDQQLSLGDELWSALDDIKTKEPTYYQSILETHGNLDRAVPCPCRPRKV